VFDNIANFVNSSFFLIVFLKYYFDTYWLLVARFNRVLRCSSFFFLCLDFWCSNYQYVFQHSFPYLFQIIQHSFPYKKFWSNYLLNWVYQNQSKFSRLLLVWFWLQTNYRPNCLFRIFLQTTFKSFYASHLFSSDCRTKSFNFYVINLYRVACNLNWLDYFSVILHLYRLWFLLFILRG